MVHRPSHTAATITFVTGLENDFGILANITE